ncbi:hypothetical protein [Polaribacter sp. 11A2H]|uniref:hypothetical protein n=1 Tax=Polaribacter sp. 11A2H TaxID=2687290 RepID=UPI00140A496C|nr:hypothetical protein [Polaribacter sp. 11A2H]
MKYYAIVNRIKDEHKSGIYGRKKLNEAQLKELNKQLKRDTILDIAIYSIPIIGLPTLIGKKVYEKFIKNKNKGKIVFQKSIKSENKTIIIPNTGLKNDYDLEDEYSYGLLDELPSKNKSFEILMKSKGGATLHILERDDMPKSLFHFGGKLGKFNEGIYIAHPKDESQLIPLNNSNSLIQSLILEETIRAYEALGAKSIKIHDLTTINADAGGKKGKVEANATSKYTKEILREKTFGKGIFDPERAKKDKLLIFDIPAVKSTIEARIEGNQLTEKYTEDINLSIGLDINVLELFKANSNFNYQRKWSFDVEFYDKSELT